MTDKPTTTQSGELQITPQQDMYNTPAAFEHAQRVAKMLASSSIIPKDYQGRVDNCLVALEMANRQGYSPLMVMQNLHVIQGKPSWSSTFIIAAINSSGKFSENLDFKMSGTNATSDDYGCEAFAKDKSGIVKWGPKITWRMVKDEGWLAKAGSKWKTMPELMFRYRAAAFFGRLHTPEIMMGLQTREEVIDVQGQTVEVQQTDNSKEAERMILMIQNAATVEELKALEADVKPEQLDWYNERMTQLTAK